MKGKIWLVLTILLILGGSDYVSACSCGNELIANRVAKSAFVASIIVIDSKPDTSNEEFHDLTIEVVELFKGEMLSEIKVWSVLNSSCAFLPKIGSNWIVFARRHNEILSFGFCSGSVDLDPDKWKNSPRAFLNNARSVKRKLSFLRFVKDNKIELSNEYSLHLGPATKLKDYEGSEGDFTIYSFRIGTDLKVRGMKELKAFDARELAKAVRKSMKQITRASKHKTYSIPTESIVTVALFYYAEEGEYESFVSIFDL